MFFDEFACVQIQFIHYYKLVALLLDIQFSLIKNVLDLALVISD